MNSIFTGNSYARSAFIQESEYNEKMGIWRRTWELFVSPSLGVMKSDEKRQAYFLSSLIIILVLFGWILEMLSIISYSQEEYYFGWVYTVILTVPLLIAYFISRSRHYRVATWLTLVILFLGIHAFTLLTDDEIYLPYLAFLSLCILFSNFFFSHQVTGLVFVVCIVSILVLPLVFPEVIFWEVVLGPMSFVVAIGLFAQVIGIQRRLIDQDRLNERIQAEENLRSAYQKMQQIVSTISSILVGVDSAGVITHWNEVAEKILGISAKEAVGSSFSSLAIDWEKDVVLTGIDHCLNNFRKVRLDDIVLQSNSQDAKLLGFTITPLMLDNEKGPGFLLVGADITERRKMENQAIQSQKMEAIGHLAAGVAHEINTPTQYVGSNLRFLREHFQAIQEFIECCRSFAQALVSGQYSPVMAAEMDTRAKNAHLDFVLQEAPVAIEQSIDGLERIARIVAAMRNLSHPGAEEKTSIDINQLLQNTLSISQSVWKNIAEVITELDPSLPLVECVPAEISQVFLNLIINAAHAIRDKEKPKEGIPGSIWISTCQSDADIVVEIRDDGCGIPNDIQNKVFDPFFTTKKFGQGTGQGLSIVYNVVVKKHGGTITFDSVPGQGTKFTVCLPIQGAYEK